MVQSFLLATSTLVVLALPSAAATCESLATTPLAHRKITLAQMITTGTVEIPGGKPITKMPPFCRVAGSIQPSSDSDIQFEVWLPAPENWNGRFQGIGNGGFAGSISYGGIGLEGAVKHGYAAASTDTGHKTKAGIDATWARNHPEKIVDYGYRAIHETAVTAKTLIQAYYGKPAKFSYFASCSNGGRQALMEAQRFPEDYDGIIAGAPANDFTNLLSGFVWNAVALVEEPDSFITPAKIPAIEKAVLSACDSKDGLKDGIIDDPRKCDFQPSTLICKGPESDECLNPAQAAALKKIYDGPRNAKGKQLFPGFAYGAEGGGGGWAGWITGKTPGTSAQYQFGTQFMKNMYLANDTWDYKTFQIGRDQKPVEKKLGKFLNSTNPDLSKLRARKGKLILFHGWNDAAIPAGSAITYYEAVRKKMGASADEFMRFYLVPGMQHCGGGPGPNDFGAYGAPTHNDASRSMFLSLQKWVEEGMPPGAIVARNAGPPERTRPLCIYPQVARYQGSGDINDALNFRCEQPK